MNDVIVVEGTGDQSFVEGFLRAIGMGSVKPFPPRTLGGPGNGISNVLKVIPLLMNQIRAGATNRAAILVDADFTGVNGGFLLRRQEITAALAPEGYIIPAPPAPGSPPGEVFVSSNGMPPIGLFILPDHSNDGMLEDVLKQMVVASPYQGTLQHATQVVSSLNPKLFNSNLHLSKAEIGTFLAWQNRPPAEVKTCLAAGVFDPQSAVAQPLASWLNQVFP